MKISLITVCFNSEEHIAATLQSVDDQTWSDIEHIIIDGGSSDSTLKIIAQFHQPWRRVVSGSDDGIYDAMNKGIEIATGDIIGFINSDDFYTSNSSLREIGSVFSDENVQACWGDLCYVERLNISKIRRYWIGGAFSNNKFVKGWNPPHPTFFVRTSLYKMFGGFDLQYKIAADIVLMARFLEVNKINWRYIPVDLVHMRLGGITNNSFSNIVKQNLEISRGFLSLGLPFSWPRFLVHKLFSRALQFITRPNGNACCD